MRLTNSLPFCTLAFVAACASIDLASTPAGAASQAFGEPITLRPGDAVEVGEQRVRVVFVGVPADSRCPRNAQCIQAGDATVRLQVEAAGQARETITLKTAPPDMSVSVGRFVVTLQGLQPEPVAGKPTRVADYRATLVLARPR